MKFATSFKASNKPSKQRLYAYNAPLHLQGKMLSCHLVKELRLKLKTRSLRVRVGDRVSVMTGQYGKKSGKVERVDVRAQRVYITGIDRQRKDGSWSGGGEEGDPTYATAMAILTLGVPYRYLPIYQR